MAKPNKKRRVTTKRNVVSPIALADPPGIALPNNEILLPPQIPEVVPVGERNIHLIFKVKFNFLDHLRMLFAGRVVVVADALCENVPGKVTMSQAAQVFMFGESVKIK